MRVVYLIGMAFGVWLIGWSFTLHRQMDAIIRLFFVPVPFTAGLTLTLICLIGLLRRTRSPREPEW